MAGEDSTHNKRPRTLMIRRVTWCAAIALLVATVGVFVLPSWLVGQGRRLVDNREHVRAETFLGIAKSLGAQNVDFQLARIARRRGDYERALELLATTNSSSTTENSELIEREKSLIQLARGQYPASVESWREFISSAKSDLPEVCEAFVYFRLSRFEVAEAHEVIDAWESQYPNSSKVYVTRAKLFQTEESWQEAIVQLQKAVSLTPEDLGTRINLAEALIFQLRLEEALKTLRYAVDQRVEPENDGNEEVRKAKFLMANCLFQTGAYSESESLLRELKDSAFDGDSEVNFLRAEIELAASRPDTALEYVQIALAQDPRNREKRYLLAQVLQKLGQDEAAQKEFDYVEEATAALLKLPKLTAMLTNRPDDLAIRFEIARLTWMFHSESDGRRWFQQLLELDPNHEPSLQFLRENSPQL